MGRKTVIQEVFDFGTEVHRLTWSMAALFFLLGAGISWIISGFQIASQKDEISHLKNEIIIENSIGAEYQDLYLELKASCCSEEEKPVVK